MKNAMNTKSIPMVARGRGGNSSVQAAPTAGGTSYGESEAAERRGISIPDVRAAIFNLLGLMLFMALLGHYVLVQMPGVGGAEWRAVMIPSHPANMPAGMLVNHVPSDYNQALLQTIHTYFSAL